ncbi:MAG: ATP-binding protein [Chloroflexi bacterium]|nr:ATP-binding protein [Chloroflexota bacterium]
MARPRLRYDRQLALALLVVALVPLGIFALGSFVRFSSAVRLEGEQGARDAVRSVASLADQAGVRLSGTAESYATWQTLVGYVDALDSARLTSDIAGFLVDRGTADDVVVVAGASDAAAAGSPEDTAELARVARAALAASPGENGEIGPGTVVLPSGIHVVSVRRIPLDGLDGPGAAAASEGGAAIAMSRRLDGGFAIDASQLTGFAVSLYLPDGRLSVTSDEEAAAAVGPPDPARLSVDAATIVDRGGFAAGALALMGRDGALAGAVTASGRLDVLNSVDAQLWPVLGLGFGASAVMAVLLAILLSLRLRRRLGIIEGGMVAVAGGDTSVRLPTGGADDVARLAESHNRLAATLERRDRTLNRALGEVAALTPDRAVVDLAGTGTAAAASVFGFAAVRLVDAEGGTAAAVGADGGHQGTGGPPGTGGPQGTGGPPGTGGSGSPERPVAPEERVVAVPVPVPPETWRLEAVLAAGQDWSDGDAALLALYGRELGAALRDAELYADAAHRAAELERVNRLQGDFLRGVSHNLQTPLTHITVVAGELADTRGDDPSVRRDAQVILAEGERLSRLVGQLLTLSRLEANALSVTAEPVSIPALVARVAHVAGAGGVRVVDDAPGLVPIGDPAAVEQVLWILFDNATRYAPPGQIRVLVSPADVASLDPRAATEADAAVAVAVDDDGPGVPPAERERVFDRFARGSTAGDASGTGLGLDVARGLVGVMGGRIRCEAAPGGGARFVFTLPAEDASSPA